MAPSPMTAKTQTPGFMIFSGLMILILSSVVLGLFFNRFEIRDESQSMPTRRIQDLVALLKQAEDKRTTLEKELADLRKKTPVGAGQAAVSTAGEHDPELQKLYQLAGFTPATGKGLVITMEDSKTKPRADDPHTDPNAGKLQADDLLKLINELKAAGASAISINDQRLIVTSEIVTAGGAIEVNQTRLSQPVVVKVLGDPDVLQGALKIRGGILEYLDFFGIRVKVDKSTGVKLPAYKGPLPS